MNKHIRKPHTFLLSVALFCTNAQCCYPLHVHWRIQSSVVVALWS